MIDPSFVLGPSKLGKMFGRSRWWARRLLKTWWEEQQRGAPVRVFPLGGGRLYTTKATVEQYMPRRKDEALERRFAGIEKDLASAISRIADLERSIGRRR